MSLLCVLNASLSVPFTAGTVFCPAEQLHSAITKLHKRQTLDFYEEYTIEGIFHESVHSRTVGKVKTKPGSIEEKIEETCTQLYAREKYVKILNAYGMKPVNFERIQTDGIGYKIYCQRLRGYFTKNGQLQLGELINIANNLEDGKRIMIKKLMGFGLSEEKAEDLLLKVIYGN